LFDDRPELVLLQKPSGITLRKKPQYKMIRRNARKYQLTLRETIILKTMQMHFVSKQI
jgi:hypothetical protein